MLLTLQMFWLLLILSLAAWQDVQTRTISNRLVLIGLIGLLFLQILNQNLDPISFIIGLIVSLILWKFKFIGGGDSKLLILISMPFIPTQLVSLYAFIAVIGTLQALYYLKYKSQKTLPYAVSILVGTNLFLVATKKTSWLEIFL